MTAKNALRKIRNTSTFPVDAMIEPTFCAVSREFYTSARISKPLSALLRQ